MTDFGLILAAGASRRMGTPKALLVWRKESLLARAIRVVRATGLVPVVVAGAEKQAIKAHCEGLDLQDLQIVENHRWEEGMGTSIAAGVQALPKGWRQVLILNVDQPLIEAEHLRRLSLACVRSAGLVATEYTSGLLGTPACFSSGYGEHLVQLKGDKGARDLIRSKDAEVVGLHGSNLDLDTPEDWQSFLKEYGP